MTRMTIVGGGIVGASQAFEAARAGYKVRLLEKNHEVAREASFGHAGILCPTLADAYFYSGLSKGHDEKLSGRVELFRKLHIRKAGENALRAVAGLVHSSNKILLEEQVKDPKFLDAVGDNETNINDLFTINGALLVLGSEDEAKAEEAGQIKVINEAGSSLADSTGVAPFSIKKINRQSAIEKEPCLANMDGHSAFYWHEPGLSTRVALLTKIYCDAVSKMGGEIKTGVDIKSFGTVGSKVTKLIAGDTREFDVDRNEVIVLATGASTELLDRVGINAPILPFKGTVITVQVDEAHSKGLPTRPICFGPFTTKPIGVDKDNGRHLLKLAGGTDSITYDTTPDSAAVRDLEKLATEALLKSIPFSVVQRWAGLRPVSADGYAMLGRTRLFENVSLNVGHCSTGLSQAAQCAQWIVKEVAESGVNKIPEVYHPDRFI